MARRAPRLQTQAAAVLQVPVGQYVLVTLAPGLSERRVNEIYQWLLLLPEVVCAQDLATTTFEHLLMRVES